MFITTAYYFKSVYIHFSHEGNKKWLGAHYDPIAAIYTFTQCIALSDIHADGDNKLIVADLGTGTYNMKLKVYKGQYFLKGYVGLFWQLFNLYCNIPCHVFEVLSFQYART